MDKFKSKKHDRPLERGRTEENLLFSRKPQDTSPRFFVVHSEDTEKAVADMTPFVVAKVLNNTIGPKFKAKKMLTGDLLVEVNDTAQALTSLN